MKNKKLGVIVPYRHRKDHLYHFKVRISHYLNNNDIPHQIFIVNQDDGKLFNRGMLLNIGFVHAKLSKCDYVVFHDVDMVPLEVDYSYSDYPTHLATNFVDKNTLEPINQIFDEYFGGVTLFPMSIFEKINGFSNKYWGWGFEDTDLLHRCRIHNIDLYNLKMKNFVSDGTVLKFNGENAYIKSKNFGNMLDFNKPLTLFISFYPDQIILNHEKEIDNFTIFSLPGYNTEISYNSFMRYFFQTFNSRNQSINIYSEIKTNYHTSIVITFNPYDKIITMYQDGIKISSKKYTFEVFDYSLEQIFYIGCSPNNSNQKESFFKGSFSKFAVFSGVLLPEEITEISTSNLNLTKNTKKYKSSKKLLIYYDTNYIKDYKLVDLSCNENDGIIINCEIVKQEIDDFKIVKIPHRRKSLFYTLKHDENGFKDNKWIKKETRWNQLRFHNEICMNDELIYNDGLSDLKYILHGKEVKNNITQLNVGI